MHRKVNHIRTYLRNGVRRSPILQVYCGPTCAAVQQEKSS